jgi:hypothetical protein
MKILFNFDYKQFKTGEVVEVTEEEAEDHRQAGRTRLFVEGETKPVKPPVKKPTPTKKHK